MKNAWRREDEPDMAVEKILEAADKAFIELGVSAAGMNEIATFASCSRATLYRYFKNRKALHLTYARRQASRIQELARVSTESIANPGQRLVEYLMCIVREVRNNPATAAWYAPDHSAEATKMARLSDIASTLIDSLSDDLPGAVDASNGARERRRWIVRVIISLLTNPGPSEADERRLVERFVVPVVLDDSDSFETLPAHRKPRRN